MTTAASPLRRRASLAIAGLAVTSMGATLMHADVASAAGGRATVNSSISLTKNSADLIGKVTSPRKVCKKKVRVVLHWRQPGKMKFRPVADDMTNRMGKWRISEPDSPNIPAGKYFVRLAKTPDCKPEKSRTITVR